MKYSASKLRRIDNRMNYNRKYDVSEDWICSLSHNEGKLRHQASVMLQEHHGIHLRVLILLY